MLILFKILISIIFIIGPIVLQIFLSKKDNKLLGLILPTINIILAVMIVLGMASFGDKSIIEMIIQIIIIFLVSNISTIILVAIYFACREKLKKSKEIEKMNIKDLN